MHPELDPATYGLTIWDLDREFLTGGDVGIYAAVGGTDRLPLGDILHVLRDAYCRTIGIEYMHIQEPEEKRWIQEQVEGAPTHLTVDDQRHILDRLNAAEALEKFLATKYVGQKRFGLEGAESLIPLLDAVLEQAADDGLDSRGARAWPTAVGSTCWSTSSARPTTSSSGSSRATSTPTPSRARATSSTTSARRACSRRAPAPSCRSSWRPTRPTSRRSTRWSRAWSAPGWTRSTYDHARRSRSCRS